jgi:hypothetical protein
MPIAADALNINTASLGFHFHAAVSMNTFGFRDHVLSKAKTVIVILAICALERAFVVGILISSSLISTNRIIRDLHAFSWLP